eukprot:5590776-Amphidinium_carterae.1
MISFTFFTCGSDQSKNDRLRNGMTQLLSAPTPCQTCDSAYHNAAQIQRNSGAHLLQQLHTHRLQDALAQVSSLVMLIAKLKSLQHHGPVDCKDTSDVDTTRA